MWLNMAGFNLAEIEAAGVSVNKAQPMQEHSMHHQTMWAKTEELHAARRPGK